MFHPALAVYLLDMQTQVLGTEMGWESPMGGQGDTSKQCITTQSRIC